MISTSDFKCFLYTSSFTKPNKKRDTLQKCIPFFHLHAHAGSHPEGGGDGGKYGNHDVQDLAPDFFVHFILKG